VRARIDRDSTDKTLGFNGAFTFDSLTAYQITEQGLAAGETPDQIRANGGGAVQFTQTVGNSFVQDNYADLGFYVQDEWKIRPNLTASYGLRYEWQNQLSNDGGLAPRFGIAWGLGKNKQGTPKAVLRAGFGIFYNRLKQQYIEQALLLNGVTQLSFVVINPDFFPNLPTPAELAAAQTSPTAYQIAPDWKTPYIIQSGITLEKQVTRNANLAITYLNSRGVHALMTRNINAPLPPAFDPSDRPLGGNNNIYQYDPSGDFKQNQFIVNGNVRMGSKLSLFGYYTLNYALSNTSGVTSFPSDQYDIALDYGRTAFDIRNRLFLGGTIGLPYMFRLSPFLVASSGVRTVSNRASKCTSTRNGSRRCQLRLQAAGGSDPNSYLLRPESCALCSESSPEQNLRFRQKSPDHRSSRRSAGWWHVWPRTRRSGRRTRQSRRWNVWWWRQFGPAL
jgi:TonB dependent receptor